MGILRKLREWREDADGTLKGPALETESASVNGPLYADAVSANQLNTAPTGSFLSLSTDQTVSNDTLTEVAWDTEENRGQVSGLLSNNAIVVPAGFDFAKITSLVTGPEDMDVLRVRINGDSSSGTGQGVVTGEPNFSTAHLSTAWLPVSENDELTTEVRHVSGSDETIESSDDRTYAEVVLI